MRGIVGEVHVEHYHGAEAILGVVVGGVVHELAAGGAVDVEAGVVVGRVAVVYAQVGVCEVYAVAVPVHPVERGAVAVEGEVGGVEIEGYPGGGVVVQLVGVRAEGDVLAYHQYAG